MAFSAKLRNISSIRKANAPGPTCRGRRRHVRRCDSLLPETGSNIAAGFYPIKDYVGMIPGKERNDDKDARCQRTPAAHWGQYNYLSGGIGMGAGGFFV